MSGSPTTAAVRGEVFGVEYMGARQVVTVDTEAGRLRVRTANSQRAAVGERVGLAFDPGQIVLFDAASERALPSALFERRPGMAEVRLEGVTQDVRRHRRGRRASTSTSRTASSSCCSGPPAPARPRPCAWSPGLERPDAGRIAIGGADVTASPPAARDVAFVFQQFSLYPHYTVFDNLAFPAALAAAPRERGPDQGPGAARSPALLRIDGKLDNRATRLSGGEMQRVAIGRALVRRPRVYLMDEPLSSLDAKLREDLRIELKRIQRELGATILYVTHDQIEAMTMADRIGVIEEGRLLQLASPREVYERPASVAVARRLGSPPINLLPLGVLPAATRPAAPRRWACGPRTCSLGDGGHRGADRAGRAAGRRDRRAAAAAGRQAARADARARPGRAGRRRPRRRRRPRPCCSSPPTAGGSLPEEPSQMSRDQILALIDAAAAAIAANADELTRLDQAIGDGDHGSNMARGFQAIAAQREALAEPGARRRAAEGGHDPGDHRRRRLGPALRLPAHGHRQGAEGGQGPGRGVRRGCREREEARQVGRRRQDHARRAGAGAGGVAQRRARPAPSCARSPAASREATKPMLATRGRASFLGERSIGHYDPGATSSCLLIHAVCDVLEAAA